MSNLKDFLVTIVTSRIVSLRKCLLVTVLCVILSSVLVFYGYTPVLPFPAETKSRTNYSHVIVGEGSRNDSSGRNTETNINSICRKCFLASFPISIDIPDLCQGNVTLVIVIQASPHQHIVRDVIRSTWLSPIRQTGRLGHVRYIFMLGQAQNESVRREVLEESKRYGDIVMSEFVDTYRNLTLKTVVSMKWISTRCSNAQFFLKTDDDVWVNVSNLLSALHLYGAKLNHSLGGVCRSVLVNRDNTSKWYVSHSEFTNKVYDPYCSGTGYVGGLEIAKGIAKIYIKVPYFHLEDVYVGMCLKALGYGTIFLPHFDNIGGPQKPACEIKTGGFVIIHKIPKERMKEIHNTTCG